MTTSSETGSIFVSIINYRDTQCQETIKNIYQNAAQPERIFLGVVNQLHPDDYFCVEDIPYQSQIRIKTLPHTSARGPCYARYVAQQLWKNEDYYLQIDCHMRFEKNWDELLLGFFHSCNDPNAIISTYPPNFDPGKPLQQHKPVFLCASHFDENQMLRITGRPLSTEKSDPIPCNFIAAGFLFSSSKLISTVPYDPYLLCLFFGEEVSLLLRLFTHGFNFYAPPQNIIYHQWSRQGRHSWREILTEELLQQERLSRARVRHICGIESSTNSTVLKELNHFGLGTERSLQDFEAKTGINFTSQTISDIWGGLNPNDFQETRKQKKLDEVLSLVSLMK